MKLFLLVKKISEKMQLKEEKIFNETSKDLKKEESTSILGAYTNEDVANKILEKYFKDSSKSAVLNENESGTSWKEKITETNYAIMPLDTEKQKCSVYEIPKDGYVLWMGENHSRIDKLPHCVENTSKDTFEDVLKEVENDKNNQPQ